MSTTTPRGHGLVAPVVVAPVIRTAATAIVFQGLIAGVLNTVAVQGDDGAVIANQATALNTDNIIFNAATIYVAALGGGEIYVEEAGYNLAATWNVSVYIAVRGAGWATILNYDAGGNCITFTGNNAKVRDLKIVIVAGAGGAGTRPNCIFADTLTNIEVRGVWGIGDQTVGDDGSNQRQCGLVFDAVTESKTLNNRFENHRQNGIRLEAVDYSFINDNICLDNLDIGQLIINSDNNAITDNTCEGNASDGIRTFSCNTNIINGNRCNGNTESGIFVFSSPNNTVTGNSCQGNTLNGIRFNNAQNNTITGNTCQGNTQNGLQLDDSSDNTVVGNTCNDNDSDNTGTYSGIHITDVSLDNMVHSNTCNDNDNYGIDIDDVRALRNWVKNNQLRGNTTGAFNDGGTDTKTPFINVLAPSPDAFIGTHAVQQMLDAVDTIIRFEVPIPREFQEAVTVEVILVAGAAGDIRTAVATNWGRIGTAQNYNFQSDAIAAGQTALLANDMSTLDIAAAFTDIASDDWIGVEFTREASDVNDTIDAPVYFLGFRLRYV